MDALLPAEMVREYTPTYLRGVLHTRFLSLARSLDDLFNIAFTAATADFGPYVVSFVDSLALFILDFR